MGNDAELEGMFSRGKDGAAGASRERRERRNARAGRTPRNAASVLQDLTGFLPQEARSAIDKDTVPSKKTLESLIRPAGTSRWAVIMGIDVPLLLVLCALVIFGLLMLNSSSWLISIYGDKPANSLFIRQLLLTLGGIAAAVAAAFFDYHRYRKLALPLMIITLVSLIALLIVGSGSGDPIRAFLNGSVQPSELAKIATVIYMAVWLFAKKDQLTSVSFGLIPTGVILGGIGSLILIQPDISAAITVVILGILMFFLAGADLKQFILVLLVGAVAGFLIIQSGIFPSGKVRFEQFIAGWNNPLESSEHVQHALQAFWRGGWFGVGLGKGDWKLTWLPVPHTDSIFAVIGEETGFVGAFFVVALFALLLWRGMAIARRAPDLLGTLMAAGLTFWIVMEAFINMAVLIGLLPFAGNPLPLISAGGSSRVVILVAFGILMNISRLSEESNKIKERTYSAVVDLRGRDWRRRVSSARRPSSAVRKG